MDLYLHAKSQHIPEQKWAVLATLVQQTHMLCEVESLWEELQHLNTSWIKTDSHTDIR
jgi:hypothetical protein